jgi:hypothetical protein
MANNNEQKQFHTPFIGIYIPGVRYTSVGPGFVDAIKLEARNAYNHEKKYNVYTKYSDQGAGNQQTAYVYRYNSSKNLVDSSSQNSLLSVQYSTDTRRCPYGYFFDYLSSDIDAEGGLSHTLTCFSETAKLNDLVSFDLTCRDGLFVV